MDQRSTHEADEARRRVLFNSIEEMELEHLINSYGVGVDCHSKFYQICVLLRDADRIRRFSDKCDAAYKELLEAKDRVQQVLVLHEHAVEPLAYTCKSTGPYHMPLIKAWGASHQS